MLEQSSARRVAQPFGVGAVAGIVISAWNLIGMYTTIPVTGWDTVRQILFLTAVAGISVVAAQTARAGHSWGSTGISSSIAAVGCAATVLAVYVLTTAVGTDWIRQVPEFIRDYTNNGYTSPKTYFADHYWALLELQVFTWVIGVVGLATVGTVLGRAAASKAPRRTA